MPPEKSLADAAVDGLGKVASDIYADVAKPAARRVGSALETLFKFGLTPVSMLDWGFEHSKVWLQRKVEGRLAQIPADSRIAPPSNVAVPILLQIAACADAPELRELYAELLLKAMDARTVSDVHPAYVSLIAQLSPPEALVFLSFKGGSESNLFSDENYYQSPSTIEQQFEEHCRTLGLGEAKLARFWLENLQRLGLLVMERGSEVTLREEDVDFRARVETTEYRSLNVTEFGCAFHAVCSPPGPVHEA